MNAFFFGNQIFRGFARNLGGNFRGMKETNKEFKTPKVKKKRNQQKNSADSF